jgi:hypothetical protein
MSAFDPKRTSDPKKLRIEFTGLLPKFDYRFPTRKTGSERFMLRALLIVVAIGLVMGSAPALAYKMSCEELCRHPLMDELNRREVVIFVHPSELAGNTVPGIPPYIADFLLDSVRAAINLSHTGVMDRYRNVKVILSHAGGFLPYCAVRMSMRRNRAKGKPR